MGEAVEGLGVVGGETEGFLIDGHGENPFVLGMDNCPFVIDG